MTQARAYRSRFGRHDALRTALGAVALATVLLAAAGPATAQSQAKDSSSVKDQKPANKEPVDLQAVTVTGSRIVRDAFNSVSPIDVITREETTLAGFASTTEALQNNAAVTGGSAQINNAFGGYVVNGGGGVNTLGLRGLSATRTLVLLNGRRISPAGSRGAVGAADLNVLPNAMIDRVEILKDGASSIYGSDAIAGVVNIITRNKVDELTLEAQYNTTEDGGGDQWRYSALWGKTGDRFDISGSYEHVQRNELTLADRDWTRCNSDLRRNLAIGDYWGSGDTIDPLTGQPKCYPITATGSNGVTINTIGTGTTSGIPAQGAIGTSFNRWRPNSAVTTGLVGFEGVGGGQTINTNIRDTFEPRMLDESMISPVKTDTLFLQGNYDLRRWGDAQAYFEVLANRRESSQTDYRQLSLDYVKGSPLIPANLASSTFSGPSSITGGKSVGVRGFIGFGNGKNEQTVDYWRATAGLRGYLFDSGWSYDFMLSQARSDADYSSEAFLTDRLAQSLDVVAGPSGGFVCRDASNGCVAAPALTSAVIGGQLPRNWVNWVFVPVVGHTSYQERAANFTVTGRLFDLPDDEARGAFGIEYRKAKIDDTPSIHSQNGNLYNLTSSAVTRGSDSVWEAFGEIELPLLSGRPWAEELTFNVSGRYTDYQSYGSDTTYKVGGLYTPVSWISLRASYGTSYRAPALFEQFQGPTSGFLNAQLDPCNTYGTDPGSIRAKNCASEGLPPNFTATSSVAVLTGGGAAAGLEAETSKNFTAGLVLQPKLPSAFGDLSFAVDYYRIEVNNGVSLVGGNGILENCYDDPQFRAGGSFCRLVNPRDPSSNQLTVFNGYINVATDIVRGYDFTLRYVRDFGQGTLRVTPRITHYLEQSNKLFKDEPFDDLNGTINFPDYAGTLDLAYEVKNWTFGYGVNWIGSMDSYERLRLNKETSAFKFHVPDYFNHYLSVRYKGDKWSATAGVRNLADKAPPTISSGSYNRVGNAPLYSGYDYVGRSFFLNLSKTF